MQYSLHSAPCLGLIFNAVHMLNICDILLSEGWHSSNIYTFRNRSLPNNDIPRLWRYFNYCISTSIRFLKLICLAITYTSFSPCVIKSKLLARSLAYYSSGYCFFLPYHNTVGYIADIEYQILSKY